MSTIEPPKTVKVTNLLNRNRGALQNYEIEWTSVSGADGYRVYRSAVPYGGFELVGSAEGATKFIDKRNTIVATNDADIYSDYNNEETIVADYVPYYSVASYTIDEDGNIEEGVASVPVTVEDSRLSCSGPFGKYSIGAYPVNACGGMKYGLPSGKYTTQTYNVIREKQIYLLQQSGQWIYWLKRKISGERCPNVDIDNNRCANGDQCNICYGTNLVGGYYDPVLIKAVIVYGQHKTVWEDLGIRAVRESKSWTIWQPKLAERDIFVLANGKRCEITGVMPSSPWMGGITFKQDFDYRELETDHVAYRVRMPGPIPAS